MRQGNIVCRKRPRLREYKLKGYVRGEKHPRVKLSDYDVDLIRTLYEEHNLPIPIIADKFESPYSTIHNIVNYNTRCARI